MTDDVVLGVDVGSTDTKVVATTRTGTLLGSAVTATRWTIRQGTRTQTDADVVVDDVVRLLTRLVLTLPGDPHGRKARVAGIGVTGMGESGVLVDRHGAPAHPMIAWHDPRGMQEIHDLGPAVTSEFGGRTGLPLSALPTAAKLAWLGRNGVRAAGMTWLGLPEYVAFRLGAARVAELSLVSRTGLFDQDTQAPWGEILERIGAGPHLLPSIVRAGSPVGRAAPGLPAGLTGAVITVAGHDHCVAAVGAGAAGPGTAFHSVGTAQVLVRPVDGTTTFAMRERLAAHGIDTVTHVLDSRPVLIAGTRTGLLMKRALALVGATADPQRAEVDAAALALLLRGRAGNSAENPVGVSGARDDDGCLRVTVDGDDACPAALWTAVLTHDRAEVERLLRLMAVEVGPFTDTLVAGGWTKMASVRAAKARALPGVRFTTREQVGAFGAALFAAHAVQLAQDHAQDYPPSADGQGAAADLPLLPSPSAAFVEAFTSAPDAAEPDAAAPESSPVPQPTRGA